MKQQIQKIIDKAITLKELQREIITLFAQTKQERKTDRIGYAAGIISSDGPDHIEENIKKLENYTEQLRKTYNFPIFSATDIFSDQTFKGISDLAVSPEEKQKKFIKFWQQIFHSGHITDIFMTPRWQLSEGALDEYTMAKKLGLKIHYIK